MARLFSSTEIRLVLTHMFGLETCLPVLTNPRKPVRQQNGGLRTVDIVDPYAEEFVAAIAEAPACGLVHLQESTVEIYDEDGVVGRIEDRSELCCLDGRFCMRFGQSGSPHFQFVGKIFYQILKDPDLVRTESVRLVCLNCQDVDQLSSRTER